jgi:hypothetical protein
MRYLVFAGPEYYPSGGVYDLKFQTDDIQEVLDFIENPIDDSSRWRERFDWVHALDTKWALKIDRYFLGRAKRLVSLMEDGQIKCENDWKLKSICDDLVIAGLATEEPDGHYDILDETLEGIMREYGWNGLTS